MLLSFKVDKEGGSTGSVMPVSCKNGLPWGTDSTYKLAVMGKVAKLRSELILKPPGCFISWPVRYRRPQGISCSL